MRRARVLGVPSARAAYGSNLMPALVATQGGCGMTRPGLAQSTRLDANSVRLDEGNLHRKIDSPGRTEQPQDEEIYMGRRLWDRISRGLSRHPWPLAGLAALVVILACMLAIPQWLASIAHS
jgi:hypothetical protein